tara:strand:- start:47 stop:346 length:300 start_codon:yes stop_codon:yes gene_type:complete
MDIVRQLKNALGSGKLLLGQNETAKACANGDAKLVIFAANCQKDYVTDLKQSHPNVTMHQVELVNRELGVACSKPFHVSTICVIDAGNSELLSLRDNIE